MVGKWHLGHADRKYWPRQRGFDYRYSAMVGEIDYCTRQSGKLMDWYRNDKPVEEAGDVAQLLGKDAVSQILEHDPKTPLFLYLAQDPSEKNNLADKHRQKIAELQKRVEALTKENAKSLFLVDAFAAVKSSAHGEPALPSDESFFTQFD